MGLRTDYKRNRNHYEQDVNGAERQTQPPNKRRNMGLDGLHIGEDESESETEDSVLVANPGSVVHHRQPPSFTHTHGTMPPSGDTYADALPHHWQRPVEGRSNHVTRTNPDGLPEDVTPAHPFVRYGRTPALGHNTRPVVRHEAHPTGTLEPNEALRGREEVLARTIRTIRSGRLAPAYELAAWEQVAGRIQFYKVLPIMDLHPRESVMYDEYLWLAINMMRTSRERLSFQQSQAARRSRDYLPDSLGGTPSFERDEARRSEETPEEEREECLY